MNVKTFKLAERLRNLIRVLHTSTLSGYRNGVLIKKIKYGSPPLNVFTKEFFRLLEIIPEVEKHKINIRLLYVILYNYYFHLTKKYYRYERFLFNIKDL